MKKYRVLFFMSSILSSWIIFSTLKFYLPPDLSYMLGGIILIGFLLLPGFFEKKFSIPPTRRKIIGVEKEKSSFGYVYFLLWDEYVKIGKANDIDKRIKQFSPKMPFEPELLFYAESKTPRKLEAEFHRMFADKRENGEWFRLDNSDLEKIKRRINWTY